MTESHDGFSDCTTSNFALLMESARDVIDGIRELSQSVEVKVNEHVGAPLLDLYLQGRRQTEARLDEVRAFMAGD